MTGVRGTTLLLALTGLVESSRALEKAVNMP